MSNDILFTIQSRMNEFSKSQKLIADFILNSYDKAAFMTANRLGKTVSVSESTVVRFAAELGYDGYPEMQKSLQEMIRTKLTSVQRISVASDRIGQQDIVSTVLQSDMEKIRITDAAIDRETFNNAVASIMEADKIYILGVRSSAALASFMAFYFNLIFDNVIHVDNSQPIEMFEKIIHVKPEDVVIGISFPRYSRRTVRAMNFSRERGATIIALTDSEESPIAKCATHLLLAKSDMASFADSLVAPLSLVNALIAAVGMKRDNTISKTFSELERIWEEYEVYEKIEE